MTRPIILTNLGAGSSLCGILLLAVLASRLCCRVATTTMQADHDQNGENPKRVEAELEPAALQQSHLTESHPSYTYPTLLEEKVGEWMKEFRGVIELECLSGPICKECTRMREEVFWEGPSFFSTNFLGHFRFILFLPQHQGEDSGVAQPAVQLQLVPLHLQLQSHHLLPPSILLFVGPPLPLTLQ